MRTFGVRLTVRRLTVVQLVTVAAVSVWCTYAAYVVAGQGGLPRWWMAVAVGMVSVTLMFGGLAAAKRSAGLDAQQKDAALAAAIESEDAAVAAARRGNSPARRFTGAGYGSVHQVLAGMPEHADLVGRPPAVEGPEDLAWAPAVRNLADLLVREIRPEDGSLAGRGLSQLVAVLAPKVPVLPPRTVTEFVRSYIAVRAGYKTTRDWRPAMSGVAVATARALVVDLVGASRHDGLTGPEVFQRLDWLGVVSDRTSAELLLAEMAMAGRVVLSEGRYRLPTFMADDNPAPVV